MVVTDHPACSVTAGMKFQSDEQRHARIQIGVLIQEIDLPVNKARRKLPSPN